jgi:hypothetical protein
LQCRLASAVLSAAVRTAVAALLSLLSKRQELLNVCIS